jgi:hypothetical protein
MDFYQKLEARNPQDACPTCEMIGGYCGGENHPSCGLFENGRPVPAQKKETNMLNLTPHAITVRLPDGSDRTFPPSGTLARVETYETSAANLDGVPTAYRRTGKVEGLTLPLSQPVLVSGMVLAELTGTDNSDISWKE